MPTYYDSQNNAIALGERLGSGGEGTVYSCDNPNLVGKIYHEPITDEKAEKLRWMAANKNEQLLKVSAWVVDVLQDAPNGKTVGFVMPKIKAKEIHELYSLKSRRVYFPEATWHFLVHTATNVARAFYNLHRNSHVMGDVNHGNCVVLADGTVKLIDCDSYSIKIGETRYPCEVGVATHLAPELQGADLGEVEREEKHDNFGLAVIIFQLLFLGRHPFAGNYLGEEDKSIEDCIREYLFAYSENAGKYKVRQPPGTLSLSKISPAVAVLFTRAFLTKDNRPEPQEWIEALSDLLANLEQCGLHPGHFYFNGLERCPWCELESQTGLMLFPFVTGNKQIEGEKSFNIFTIESLIASFGINENLPVKPLLPAVLPPPAPEILETREGNKRQMLVSCSIQFFGLIVLLMLFGAGIAFFVGMASMMFWLIYWKGSTDFKRDDVVREFSGLQAEWDVFEEKWQHNALPQTLDNDLVKIRGKVADYQKFQQESVRGAKKLQDDLTKRELFQHLRSVSVEDEDFDEQEKQWLSSKGIKTAAEVTESRVRMFNDFNGELVPKLLEWRNKLELEFASVPRSVKFKEQHEEYARETSRERRRIEMDIEQSLTVLRSGAVNLRRRHQELADKSKDLTTRYLQAKSNVEAMGSNSPAVVVLVLITILTPYFGFVVGQINNPPVDNYSSSTKKPDYSSDVSTSSTTPNKTENDYTYALIESYTDQEIASLSGTQRTEYAEKLFSQATTFAYGGNSQNYDKAAQRMRQAIRLVQNEPRFLNQLGYVLYELEDYRESLKYLNQSLKIDKSNTMTKIYISINYLKMKRFRDAQQILTEVVKQYPGSFEGNYNLGLAYIGQNNYRQAAKFLEDAAKIGKDDVDTHYQLAVSYHKIGKQEKAEEEYYEVLRLDSSRAEELADEIEIVIATGLKGSIGTGSGMGSGNGYGTDSPPPPPPPPSIRTERLELKGK